MNKIEKFKKRLAELEAIPVYQVPRMDDVYEQIDIYKEYVAELEAIIAKESRSARILSGWKE